MRIDCRVFVAIAVFAALFSTACGRDYGQIALKNYLATNSRGNYSTLVEAKKCGSFSDFCIEAVVRTEGGLAVDLSPALHDESEYLIAMANRFYSKLHLSADDDVFRGDFVDDAGCSNGCSITVIKSKSQNLYYINIFKT